MPADFAILKPDVPAFGGLSGLEVAEPDQLYAVSDRGWVMRIGKQAPHPVTGFQELGGLPQQRYLRDVESLRRVPGGGLWVAYEGANRIAVHKPGWAGLTAPPSREMLRSALRGFTGNQGLEAIAALPDGRGLAMIEQTGRAAAVLFDAKGRHLRHLAYQTDLPPVDALALPDGGLLILTRTLVWPLPPSFVTRLEYAAPGWDETDRFQSRPLFRLDNVLPPENYEGMAAEPLEGGGWRIWLVSDDNHFRLQSTILAWLDLPESCLQPNVHCRLERGITAMLPAAPELQSHPNPALQ